MAWRRPRFFGLHAARDVGVSAITTVGTESTTQPLENLINERADHAFAWTDSSAAHVIDIDLGADFVTGIDALFIPLGHDLSGAYIKVEEDTTSAFSTPTTLLAATLVVSNSFAILYDLTTASTERYIRVSFPTTSGAWTIPELWLSTAVDPTRGIEQGWTAGSDVYPLEFTNGTAVSLDDNRRVYEFTFRYAGHHDAADLTALSDFIAYVSTHRPFVVEPPWTLTSVGMFKLSEQPRVDTEDQLPADRGIAAKRFDLAMTEFLR